MHGMGHMQFECEKNNNTFINDDIIIGARKKLRTEKISHM